MRIFKAISMLLAAGLISGTMTAPVFAEENDKLIAFPGVEGGGKYTSGARAADEIEVYHVTNLNDSGSGSLREGISKSGRIIVFDVGGIINLESRLDFMEDNITILGQTAPGDGITISGYDSVIKANNIIIRYLRIRPTDIQNGEPDALGGRWIHDIVLDHCSVSWGVDEMLTLYSGSVEGGKTPSQNITVQYCLSSESLRMSSHIKGAHGYGGIVGGTEATWHHNMFAHHDSRNPRFDRNLKSTDFVNNVVYNWGNNIMYGAEPYSYNKEEQYSTPEYVSNINIHNNYIKSGPSTKPEIRGKIFEATNDGTVFYDGEQLKTNAYIKDNYVYGNAAASADNAAAEGTIVGRDKLNLLDTPVDMGEFKTEIKSAELAYEEVIADVGATLPKRDAIDARVIADAINGTGRIINRAEEVGGFVSIEESSRVFEIPSEWKSTQGMADAKESDIAPDGYTWIEKYVNDWTMQQEAASNPKVKVLAPATADTSKTVDKTGKGFWTIVDADDSISYSAEVVTADGKAPASVMLYDGTKALGMLESENGIYSTEIKLESGTHYLTSLVTDSIGQKTTSDTAIVYVTDGQQIKEIGSVPYEGESRVWTKDGKKYIAGSGAIGGSSDSFSYDYMQKNGDFAYTLRIDEIPKYENGPLAGIMVRKSLESDSEMIMLSDTWKKYGENIIVPIRREKGKASETLYMNNAAGEPVSNENSYDTKKYPLPRYMRVERKGDTLALSVSDSGIDWSDNVRQPLELDISGWGEDVYVGIACDSRNELTKEASPVLPWMTIAAFCEMRNNPLCVTVKYDESGNLAGTVTADTAEPGERNKLFVFYI